MVIPLLTALALAQAPAARTWTVDPARSVVRYEVVHKLHKVEGASRKVEGRVALASDARVMTMLRAPVATFESGDANRDAHMQEVLDVAKFPFVTFKGLARLPEPPSQPARSGAQGPPALPQHAEVPLQGELELHGVKRPVALAVSEETAPDGAVHVTGSFDVSLDAHAIERPALLFVKVDDTCRIALDLWLTEEKR